MRPRKDRMSPRKALMRYLTAPDGYRTALMRYRIDPVRYRMKADFQPKTRVCTAKTPESQRIILNFIIKVTS